MRAARAVAASRFVIELAALASSILLAHLLTPAEIGRAVIALVVIPLSTLLLNGVIGPLLIQRQTLDKAHAEAGSALGLAGGAIVAVLCLAAAPLFAELVDDDTGTLVALAAPAFLFSGIGVVPDALLRRELRFGPLAMIDVGAALTGILVSVGLAIAGAGPSSLVLGSLLGIAVGCVAVCAVNGYTRPGWHPTEAREIIRFGRPAGLAGLATVFYRRIDYLIVGARLGTADLGAYWRAYQLGAEYQTKLTTVMLRVAFPLYSRLTDIDELRRVRSRVVRLHAAMVVPPLALLIATAPELIPFVYGEAWEPAVVPTQLLAVVGMLNALTTGVGPLLMAIGRTELLNRFAWIAGLCYAIVIFFAAPGGLVTVSVAAVAFVAVGFVASQELLVRRPVGIPWSELIAEAGPSFIVSAVIVAAGLPLVSGLEELGLPAPVTLLVATAVALLLYVLLMPRLAPGAWGDLRSVLSRSRARDEPATSDLAPGTAFSATEPAPTVTPDG